MLYQTGRNNDDFRVFKNPVFGYYQAEYTGDDYGVKKMFNEEIKPNPKYLPNSYKLKRAGNQLFTFLSFAGAVGGYVGSGVEANNNPYYATLSAFGGTACLVACGILYKCRPKLEDMDYVKREYEEEIRNKIQRFKNNRANHSGNDDGYGSHKKKYGSHKKKHGFHNKHGYHKKSRFGRGGSSLYGSSSSINHNGSDSDDVKIDTNYNNNNNDMNYQQLSPGMGKGNGNYTG